jgi:hypothetical protein
MKAIMLKVILMSGIDILLSVILLSVILAACHFPMCHSAEIPYAESHSTELQ